MCNFCWYVFLTYSCTLSCQLTSMALFFFEPEAIIVLLQRSSPSVCPATGVSWQLIVHLFFPLYSTVAPWRPTWHSCFLSHLYSSHQSQGTGKIWKTQIWSMGRKVNSDNHFPGFLLSCLFADVCDGRLAVSTKKTLHHNVSNFALFWHFKWHIRLHVFVMKIELYFL